MLLGPGDDVVGAGLDRRLEHRLVVGGLAVEDDEPDPVEHEGNRAGLRQRAARLGEIGAHLARGAIAVVGQRFDDHRDAAGRVALVAHLVVVLAFASRRLLDRPLDVVLGHVLRPRRDDGGAKARVHRRIGKAQFRRDRDFARELGEELGADRVLLALLVHDVLELAMTGHTSPRWTLSIARDAPG